MKTKMELRQYWVKTETKQGKPHCVASWHEYEWNGFAKEVTITVWWEWEKVNYSDPNGEQKGTDLEQMISL